MTSSKKQAIGQMTRAVNGLEAAIRELQKVYPIATINEKSDLLEQITALGERLDINRIFLAHLKTSEVTVTRASRGEFARLDRALVRLQELEVNTNSVTRVLQVARALASSVKQARKNVSKRAT